MRNRFSWAQIVRYPILLVGVVSSVYYINHNFYQLQGDELQRKNDKLGDIQKEGISDFQKNFK